MTLWIWVCFVLLVLGLLALDLGVFNRNPHVVSPKEALGWTAVWVTLSLVFSGVVFLMYEHHWLGMGLKPGHEQGGKAAALAYFTGYIVEESLSLDNIFVIALIVSYFRVPDKYQHRLLFWGILGALVMRGTMIGAGIAVIQRFSWVIYVFGGLLIVTAIKMMFDSDETLEPEKNPVVRLFRRIYPVTNEFHGPHFFVKLDGRWAATPLALALVIVETSDLLFAVDSIPAVFAVTLDPFIVFTSNVFAILGLRSLYFALAAVLDRFHYLKSSLVFVLVFVGTKMVLSHHYPISSVASLAVIFGILTVGVFASMLATRIERAHARASNGQAQSTRARGNNVRRAFVVISGATVGAVGVLLIIGSLGPALAFPVLVVGLLLEFAVARWLVGKLAPGGHGSGEIAARHVNVAGSQGAAKGSGVEPTV